MTLSRVERSVRWASSTVRKSTAPAFTACTAASSPPPSAAGLVAAEQQARQREELNMLYVAMTRAKHCLAISSVQPASPVPGSWWGRLAPLTAEVQLPGVSADGAAALPAAVARDEIVLAELPEVLPELRVRSDPSMAATDDGPAAGEGAAATVAPSPAARLGEAMHQLLEQAGAAGATFADLRTQGWSAARLARLARDFDITPAAARAAAQAAQRILAGEGAWAWDGPGLTAAINEAPLRHQGQSLRLDRLVHCSAPPERAGWWVLDYKSAAQPERQGALMAQLQRYREAVRRALPGEPVRAAFLTGDGRLVLVPDDAAQAGAAVQHPLQEPRASAPPAAGPAAPTAPHSTQGSLF